MSALRAGLLIVAVAVAVCLATNADAGQSSSEREIQLSPGGARETPLELLGLPKPEIAGFRISGFFVGSFSYNSHIQMMPEFAGGAQAIVDAGSSGFRFDKFGLGVSKTFASWLSAGAAIEVEKHRERHAHGFDPVFGCPGTARCVERFGTETPETETNLDKFNVTGIVPLGNGLALSVGRFDTPFGLERHDEPLLLTATTSEVFQFGRPQRMTGFQMSYPVTPGLDMSVWVVNRWESETTHADFDDNNRDKSFGGRIGFTPLPGRELLNVGIGGFWGPERNDVNGPKRWVLDLDFTWSPLPRLLFAAEFIYGGEDTLAIRERGIPYAQPAAAKGVHWWGSYLLVHYDFHPWLGLSVRYGIFDDMDAARTGVKQVLQSWTLVPIVHLTRLIPDLRPTGATYARTRHQIDWVDLKLEYRLNRSNMHVFSDAKPGVDILDAEQTSHQFQLQLVVNF